MYLKILEKLVLSIHLDPSNYISAHPLPARIEQQLEREGENVRGDHVDDGDIDGFVGWMCKQQEEGADLFFVIQGVEGLNNRVGFVMKTMFALD